MSGISTSLTFVLPVEQVDGVLGNLAGGPDVPLGDWFSASSRNNQLEHNYRMILAQYPAAGLEYLRSWEDVRQLRRWNALVTGQEIPAATAALEQFFAQVHSDPDPWRQAWEAHHRYLPESEPFQPPRTFQETRTWLQELCLGADGETPECALGFLWGQLVALRLAQSRGESLLLASWLY